MSYTIRIAHPNDIIHGRWKIVACVEDAGSVRDWMHSPSVNVDHGTVLNVHRKKHRKDETYIHNGTRWEFVGVKLCWNAHESHINERQYKGLPKTWATTSEYEWMLFGMECCEIDNSYFVQIARRLMRRALLHDNEHAIRLTMDTTYPPPEEALPQVVSCYYNLLAINGHVYPRIYVVNSIDNLMELEENAHDICDIIRDVVPFYEIATRI